LPLGRADPGDGGQLPRPHASDGAAG